MTIAARFDTFHLSTKGAEVVYGGRTAEGAKVEIRQPASDADVMVVLLAGVLEKTRRAAPGGPRSHAVDAVRVEAAEDGGVVLSFLSTGLTRSFRLDGRLAQEMAANVADVARRSRLRVAP